MWRTSVSPDSLSLCSHYLKMIFAETEKVLATGTGFIYKHEDVFYLITNGHNITGINPESGQRLSKVHSGFPTKITTAVRYIPQDEKRMAHRYFDINLYDENDQYPLWYVHPEHSYKVDVVAIPICSTNEVPENYKLFPINEHPFEESSPNVADDAFIIGFPLDIVGNHELPIWKRATIATEIAINLDGLPKLLVDTATRSGMSGSPVIYQRGGYHQYKPDRSKDFFGTLCDFLGVYSGRIGAEDNLQAQLGIVWKKHVIDEILQAKTLGTTEFQSA